MELNNRLPDSFSHISMADGIVIKTIKYIFLQIG